MSLNIKQNEKKNDDHDKKLDTENIIDNKQIQNDNNNNWDKKNESEEINNNLENFSNGNIADNIQNFLPNKNILHNNKDIFDKVNINKNINNIENSIKKETFNNNLDNNNFNIKIPDMISINIVKKNYCMWDLDNIFEVFKMHKDGCLYLIYSLLTSFICYDLIDEVIVIEIKDAHSGNIINFRHIYDNNLKKDIIMTISGEDNNVKLWDAENWECLLNIKANTFGIMFSACFLYDNESGINYIVTSNCTGNEYIKIFDFNGKKIKEVPFHPKDNENNNSINDENDMENENNINNENNNEINNDNIDAYNNKTIYEANYDNNVENYNDEVNNDEYNIYDDNDNNNNDNNNEINNENNIVNNLDNEKDIENNFVNNESKYNNKYINNNNEKLENNNDEAIINNFNSENNNKNDNINNRFDMEENIIKKEQNLNNLKNENNIINNIINNKIINRNSLENVGNFEEENNVINFNKKIDEKNLNLTDYRKKEKNNENDLGNIINENENNLKEEKKVNNLISKYTKEDNSNYINNLNDIINILKHRHQNNKIIKYNSDLKVNIEYNNNNIINYKIKLNMIDHILNNYLTQNHIDNIINNNIIENNKYINKENDISNDHNNGNNEIINENNNQRNYSQNDVDYNEENNNNEDFNIQKEETCDNIYFVETYYDKKNNFTYIIVCCSQYVKSFNYNLNILYNKYQDHDFENRIHSSAVINEKENLIELIESCIDGYIRIWNFHENILLNRILVCEQGIKGICLWDKNYLFIGCDDKSIKILQLSDGNIIKILFGHQAKVCTIKTINNKKYGKCIISKGWGNDDIKLWINNEIN